MPLSRRTLLASSIAAVLGGALSACSEQTSDIDTAAAVSIPGKSVKISSSSSAKTAKPP
jgi:hypothetical protein